MIKSPPLPWKPPSHRLSVDREQQFAAKKHKARVRWRSEHPRKKNVYDYGELPDIIAVRRDFTLGNDLHAHTRAHRLHAAREGVNSNLRDTLFTYRLPSLKHVLSNFNSIASTR